MAAAAIAEGAVNVLALTDEVEDDVRSRRYGIERAIDQHRGRRIGAKGVDGNAEGPMWVASRVRGRNWRGGHPALLASGLLARIHHAASAIEAVGRDVVATVRLAGF